MFFVLIGCWGMAKTQSPWVKEKGSAYVQGGVNFFRYSSGYDDPQNFSELSRPVTEVIVPLYGEIGLTKKLSTTLSVPIHYTQSSGLDSDWVGISIPNGNLVGFGNVYGGVNYNLLKKKGFVFSSHFGVYANSINRNVEAGLATGYDAFGFEPFLSAGYGTAKHFYTLSTGVNLRTNNYSPQYKLNLQWGARFGKRKRGWFIVSMNTQLPLVKSSPVEDLQVNGLRQFTYLYLNHQGYVALNLKWGYEWNNWYAWFSVGGGPGWDVGQAGVYSLSLAKKIERKKKV